MSPILLVLIAFSLSMDAFAVSITNGMTINNIRLRDACKIGIYFGLFQALMPAIGWSAGINFRSNIVMIDHWITFALLSVIGIKMVICSLKKEKEKVNPQDVSGGNKEHENPLTTKVLLLLAVATSIDTLAAGVSFAFLDMSIMRAALIIGLTTFTISTIGVLIGKKCGNLLQKKAEIIGGIVLVLIGFKILVEHTSSIMMR